MAGIIDDSNPFLSKNLGGGAGAAQSDNPFSSQALEGAQRARVRNSASEAVDYNPDQYARARQLSGTAGVPAPYVNAELPIYERRAKVQTLQEALDATTTLKRRAQDPDFLRDKHDDIEALTGLEQIVGQFRNEKEVLRTQGFAAASKLARQNEAKRSTGSISAYKGPEATPGNIASGLGTSLATGLQILRNGLQQAVDDYLFQNGTVEDQVRGADLKRKRAQLDAQRSMATPEFDTATARFLYGGAESVVANAPGIALSIASGSAVPGLAVAGAQTAAEAYGRYKGRGATKQEAALGAGLEAGIEILTEKIPMSFVVDRLGKAGFGDFLKGVLGREMIGEQVATLAQDAVDTAIANPDKTWGDYLRERPEAAVQTAFAVLMQAGTLAAVSEGVGRFANTLEARDREVQKASENAQQIEKFLGAAAASMTRERDPKSFSQLVQEIAEESGTAPSQFYIDASRLVEVVGEQGVQQLRDASPSIGEQIDEALATNGTVAMPIGELATNFAGTGLENAIAQHLRVSPEAYSAYEAEEAAAATKEQLAAEAEQVIAEQQDADAFQASAQSVFDEIGRQLTATKRFTPDVTNAYATLVRDFYTVQAGRMGITPDALYAQFPLMARATAPAGAQTLAQSNPALDAVNAFDTNPRLQYARMTGPEWLAEVQKKAPELVQPLTELGLFENTGPVYKSDFVARVQRQNAPLPATVTRGAKPGEVSVQGVHFSKERRDMLDGRFYGTGMKGAEASRVSRDASIDERLKDRVYVYVDEGQGVNPEIGVGGTPHSVALSNLYDAVADPLDIFTGADVNAREQRVLDAGFDGYYVRDAFGGQGSAVILGEASRAVPASPIDGVFNQSATLRSGKETLKKYGLKPGVKYNTREIAAALEARQRAKYGLIDPKDRSDESAKRIAKWMIAEVEFEMQHPEKSGVGWYSYKFQRALDIFANEFPELATDQDARDTLTALIAITSDGQKVGPNFAQAADIYANFRETGSFTTTRGHQRQESILGNLERIQAMYEQLGAKGMRDFLMQEDTVANLRKRAAEQGVEFNTQYQANVKLPLAATILGPKLGAFYANLMGASGYLTMDRWWSRTFNRYRGTLLQAPTREGLDRFKQLIGKPGISDDEAIAATVEPRNSYAARGFKEGSEIEKAANTIYKAAFENLEDAPFNATDRSFMLKAVALAQKGLARKGVDITVADIQAVLWYYEKRLYGELGARQSADISYEEAANRVVADRLRAAGRSDALGDAQAGRGGLAEDVPPGLELFDEFQTGLTPREALTFPLLNIGLSTAELGDGSLLPVGDVVAAVESSGISVVGVFTQQSDSEPTAVLALSRPLTRDEGDALSRRLQQEAIVQRDPSGAGKLFGPMADNWGPYNPDYFVLPDGTRASQLSPTGVTDGQVFNQSTRPERAGDGSGRAGAREIAPLPGAPSVPGFSGPDPRIVAVAEQYARENGINLKRQAEYVQVDPERAKRLADAYAAMQHAPNDPAVREAYENLIRQTRAQYDALVAAGYKFWFVDTSRDDNLEYISTPWNAMRDLRANQVMGVFPTDEGFGSGSDFSPEANPLLADTGLEWPVGDLNGPMAKVYANDLFRAVHDAFGHGMEGAGFRAQGEENAWQAHVRLFTGTAVAAITSETRGQNSYVNFGPFGDKNRTASGAETDYAPQKAGLMPEWTWTEGRAADAPGVDIGAFNQSAQTSTPAFQNWFRDSKVVDAAGQPLVVYHGARPGSDIKAFREKKRDGIYFTPDVSYAEGYTSELFGNTGAAGAIYPAYVSLQNPLIVSGEWGSPEVEAFLSRGLDAEALKAQGYDGAMLYIDGQLDQLMAFNSEQIKSVNNSGAFDPNNPDILAQGDAARGQFNPGTLEISLLEKADLSTFLHELGHAFFEIQATIAAQPGAPADIVADVQGLLQFAGHTGSVQEWLALPVDTRREGHERVAESFEQYLFEGKAPTLELQSLFRKFRSWLVAVYRSLADFLQNNPGAQLTDEVRGVFDRMLASEQAINTAREARSYAPMFKSAEDAGMTPEEWSAYQAVAQADTDEALEEHQSRMLRDMKWLDNAKGRKLRELQKEAKEKRAAVRDEVAAEVAAEPVYRAIRFLKRGEGAEPGTATKLDINAVKTILPRAQEAGVLEDLGYGKYGMLANDGLHPDMVAQMFGFRTGEHMIREIRAAQPEAEVVNGITDQRMLERYGDLTDAQAMEEAANAALASDTHAKMVATELAAVNGAVGSRTVLRKAAKELAEEIVARRKVRALRPDQAAASAARERKAAEKAMGKDNGAAATAKRNELLHVQLERAQRDAKSEVEKAQRNFAKIFKGTDDQLAKSRDVDIVKMARAVLARYGLASQRAGERAQSYLELLETYDGAMAADLKSIVGQLPEAKDFKDLTVEEFRGVRDTALGLWNLARSAKQITVDGEKIDLDIIASEIVERVQELSGGTLPPLPGYTSSTTRADEFRVGAMGIRSALSRVESWADRMGPVFKRVIWQPVSEAAATARTKRGELIKAYRDLLAGIESRMTYTPIDAPELGFVFNGGKAEVLHAVLHSGNKSNLTKLLVGRGWGMVDEQGNLDTTRWQQFVNRMIEEGVLGKEEFDFAQGVWDLLESIKPDAQRAHHEMYGYYFNEVTANPVFTPFGVYRGGYVPALADSLSSPDAAQKREQEDLLHAGNSFMFPSTGKGFTQSRVQYNRPLELDLRTIASHLDKVTRFTYLEPAIRDVGKVLTNRRVARALNGYDQTAISNMLTPWLQRTARQTVSVPGKLRAADKFYNGLRARSGMVIMFGNVVNTLQQLTGFSVAAIKVPAPALLRAATRLVRQPKQTAAQAAALSPWLADRMKSQSFEMQDQIEKILTDENILQKGNKFMQRNAYFLQQGLQNVMDVVIWTGAYDNAVRKGATQKQAVRAADEAVRTTQGSFASEDIAAIESNTPFVRLFTQFFGYFNMLANTLGTEATKAVREMGYGAATPRLLFIWFAGLALPAVVAQIIAQGLPDDEDDEDGDGLLDEWLALFFGSQARTVAAMAPGVGQIAQLVANNMDKAPYNDRLSVPAVSMLESSARAGSALLQGQYFDGELTKKEARDALTLIGIATGVPTGPVARAVGYELDVQSGKKEPTNPVEYATGLATGR